MALDTDIYNKEYFEQFGALDYEPYRLIRNFATHFIPPLKVLVIGAPTTYRQVSTFKKRGDEIIFIDVSPVAVEYGQAFAKTIQMDVRKMDFQDSYFDVVICRYLLEHYDNVECVKILQEIARVSKKWIIVGVSTTDVRPQRLAADLTHVNKKSFSEWTHFLKTIPFLEVVSAIKTKEIWLLRKTMQVTKYDW